MSGSSTGSHGALAGALADRVRGTVTGPGDETYDDARAVWNAAVDRNPAAVVRVAGVADVLAAVRFARENDLPMAVRSGGHAMAGDAVRDGAVVLDLRSLDGVRIDPEARVAHVGGGVNWATLNHETAAFGLLVPGIEADTVGVSGFTLGGGLGPFVRAYGAALDSLRAVDIVTADGELVTASESENPDLFWAVRGGGGAFGVVTRLEFDCHPVGESLLRGEVVYPAEEAGAVFRRYRDFFHDAPDEVGCYAMLVGGASIPHPEFDDDEPYVLLTVTYAGDPDEGRAVLEPLLAGEASLLNAVEERPYPVPEPAGEGLRVHYESRYLAELGDEAIDAVLDASLPLPGPHCMVAFGPMDGAHARLSVDETAYPHRDAAHLLSVFGHWLDADTDADAVAWADDVHAAVDPWATGGEYFNNQTDGGEARARAAFGENYDRLRNLKDEWDPEGRFGFHWAGESAVR